MTGDSVQSASTGLHHTVSTVPSADDPQSLPLPLLSLTRTSSAEPRQNQPLAGSGQGLSSPARLSTQHMEASAPSSMQLLSLPGTYSHRLGHTSSPSIESVSAAGSYSPQALHGGDIAQRTPQSSPNRHNTQHSPAQVSLGSQSLSQPSPPARNANLAQHATSTTRIPTTSLDTTTHDGLGSTADPQTASAGHYSTVQTGPLATSSVLFPLLSLRPLHGAPSSSAGAGAEAGAGPLTETDIQAGFIDDTMVGVSESANQVQSNDMSSVTTVNSRYPVHAAQPRSHPAPQFPAQPSLVQSSPATQLFEMHYSAQSSATVASIGSSNTTINTAAVRTIAGTSHQGPPKQPYSQLDSFPIPAQQYVLPTANHPTPTQLYIALSQLQPSPAQPHHPQYPPQLPQLPQQYPTQLPQQYSTQLYPVPPSPYASALQGGLAQPYQLPSQQPAQHYPTVLPSHPPALQALHQPAVGPSLSHSAYHGTVAPYQGPSTQSYAPPASSTVNATPTHSSTNWDAYPPNSSASVNVPGSTRIKEPLHRLGAVAKGWIVRRIMTSNKVAAIISTLKVTLANPLTASCD